MDITILGNAKMPSCLNDPFKKNCVTHIRVSSSYSFGKLYHRGCVEFENGNTKGEQRFEGESFDDVVIKIKSFIDLELS